MFSFYHFIIITVVYILVCWYLIKIVNKNMSIAKLVFTYMLILLINYGFSQKYYMVHFLQVFNSESIQVEKLSTNKIFEFDAEDLIENNRYDRAVLMDHENVFTIFKLFDEKKILNISFYDSNDRKIYKVSFYTVNYSSDFTDQLNGEPVIGRCGLYKVRFSEDFYLKLEKLLYVGE